MELFQDLFDESIKTNEAECGSQVIDKTTCTRMVVLFMTASLSVLFHIIL